MPYVYPTTVSNKYTTSGTRIPNPSLPLGEGLKSSSIVFTADSGHEQRRKKGMPKRTFSLNYIALTQDQYFTLRDFFMQVLNVYEFTWTHPLEKTDLNVKFAMETFTGENFGWGVGKGPLYKLQISLEQVWL